MGFVGLCLKAPRWVCRPLKCVCEPLPESNLMGLLASAWNSDVDLGRGGRSAPFEMARGLTREDAVLISGKCLAAFISGKSCLISFDLINGKYFLFWLVENLVKSGKSWGEQWWWDLVSSRHQNTARYGQVDVTIIIYIHSVLYKPRILSLICHVDCLWMTHSVSFLK